MKFKKIASLMLGAVMLTAGAAVASACGGKDDDGNNPADAKYKYDITVWVGETTKEMTKTMIDKFNSENEHGIYFTPTIEEVTESKAGGDILSKPAGTAPEIFCFAQDQIARLVSKGLLAKPSSSIEANIKETHSATAVSAATVGSSVYAYPLTEDNGYFLYYDKSVLTENDVKTVDGIIAKCNSTSRKFSFPLDSTGAGWYTASFFYATGAKSEWTTNDNGRFTGYDDTYNSDKGMIALKGIQQVVQSNCYNNSGEAAQFSAGIPSAAVVSGVWDYETAKDKLGDNLGIAPLPSFTVDGRSYQLASYLGCKLLGVSPQTDSTKASALSILAQYLTNADSQKVRFESRGWGPSVKSLQADEAITSDALTALRTTATIPQGQYPYSWWTIAQTLGGKAKDAGAGDTIALQNALNNYSKELDGFLNENE